MNPYSSGSTPLSPKNGIMTKKIKAEPANAPPFSPKRELSAAPSTPRAVRESSAESSLYDDTPPGKTGGKKSVISRGKAKETTKRKRESETEEKKGVSGKAKPVKKAKTTASRSASSSYADELKRLKAYVVACGVRKQWKKVFESQGIAGEDDRSLKRQIAAVRTILGELGMSGRLSMEKAKKIRAEREFAEELEAVQQGSAEWSTKKTRSKSKRGGGGGASKEKDSEEAYSGEEESTRKFNNSLADFAEALNCSDEE